MKKWITILLFIALILDVFAITTQNKMLRFISKPLLVPLITTIYIIETQNKSALLFVLALFFSFLGDIALLFDNFFVSGLVCFLCTHLLYIYIITRFIKKKKIGLFIKYSIPFLLLFSLIIYITYPKLDDLLLPVCMYGTIISVFGVVSLINYLQKRTKENSVLLIGSILFITSDSFIAIDKFYTSHYIFKVLIITLYVIAQYLICKSMIKKQVF